MNLNPYGIDNLRAGIVRQAIDDYVDLLLGYNEDPSYNIYELNNFFNSAWFDELIDLDKDMLLKKVRLHELKKIIDVFKRANDDDVTTSFQINIHTPKKQKNIRFAVPPVLTEKWLETLNSQLYALCEIYETAQSKSAKEIDMVESYFENIVKQDVSANDATNA